MDAERARLSPLLVSYVYTPWIKEYIIVYSDANRERTDVVVVVFFVVPPTRKRCFVYTVLFVKDRGDTELFFFLARTYHRVVSTVVGRCASEEKLQKMGLSNDTRKNRTNESCDETCRVAS